MPISINTITYKVIGGCVLSALLLAPPLWAGDAAAGKTVAQRCANCHQPADWKGETDATLQSLLRDVVSGKVKHHKAKVELSEAEIADLTSYWLLQKSNKSK